MKNVFFLGVILLCTRASIRSQQIAAELDSAKSILRQLKTLGKVSYKYSIGIEYPNKQHDRIEGTIYENNGSKILYNNCDAFTMLYNGNWFFKADHRNKTVTVFNLDKTTDKGNEKRVVDKDIFSNQMASRFIDSILIKYATLKSFSRSGDTVNINLAFPPRLTVKEFSFSYVQQTEQVISFHVEVFQATDPDNNNKGIKQIINYQRIGDEAESRNSNTDNFFVVNNGKLFLKKYNEYKVIAKL